MIIRRGDLKDLNACLLVENSYVTDHVWQVRSEERPYEETIISFRTVRLPRSVRASSARDKEYLVHDWERGECFLVAEEDDEVRGYLDMTVQAWHRSGWINDMAVSKDHRRQGIGTALLQAAFHWAKEEKLRAVMAEAQTKNHPAISFLRKHGFVFCGFNDHYYLNHDIAVFFVRAI